MVQITHKIDFEVSKNPTNEKPAIKVSFTFPDDLRIELYFEEKDIKKLQELAEFL